MSKLSTFLGFPHLYFMLTTILGNLSSEIVPIPTGKSFIFLQGNVFYSQLKALHASHPYKETFSIIIGKLFPLLLSNFSYSYREKISFPLGNCSHSNFKNLSSPMENIPSENFHFHWEKFTSLFHCETK